jgi:hypothetical protein
MISFFSVSVASPDIKGKENNTTTDGTSSARISPENVGIALQLLLLCKFRATLAFDEISLFPISVKFSSSFSYPSTLADLFS